METALRVLVRHALLMLVATVVQEWASVLARSVEPGPARDPEVLDPRNVRQKARRLFDIDAVLALMSGNQLKTRAFSKLVQLRLLPDARWGTMMSWPRSSGCSSMDRTR